MLSDWILDGREVQLPHVWGEDVDLRWEGPAVYSASLVVSAPGWLVFHGVSARAKVLVDGYLLAEHLGIWDAFSVFIELGRHDIRVEVTKNGGPSIPVDSIASGFLPFVFGTFGGIYKLVEWVEGVPDPLAPSPPAPPRASFEGHKLFVDGSPVYLRGLLHWGWYPHLRHPNPSRELCAEEIRSAKAMGFNCIKFCLWVPPHHYFEELEKAGMLAWLELPIWNPKGTVGQYEFEVTRIVEQNRHHKSIILWTIGCELGSQMSRLSRKRLFEKVKELTGGALVKDSSGGAEMYGGDPVEFGDFEDFHPYCDLRDYPAVLDALASGSRRNKAILLGECNDFDSHRDLPRIVREGPYWASSDPALNEQGMRWQFDLPEVLARSRFAKDGNGHSKLMRQSLEMKLFVHRTFQEWLRSREFSGSVITGIADTPISSSGFFDDWGDLKFEPKEIASFMAPNTFFLIPQRRLPWVDGGNKVGFWDAWHVFEGPQRLRVGMHSEAGYEGTVQWSIGEVSGEIYVSVQPLMPTEVCDFEWFAEPDTSYVLTLSTAGSTQTWPIESVAQPQPNQANLIDAGSVRAPAFREAAYEILHPELDKLFSGKPHTLHMALQPCFLEAEQREIARDPLMLQIDTRTYRELPVVAIEGRTVFHSLRIGDDPAGILVQRALARIASE
jgi:hypothetical protein